jgi:hypothetical protein
MLWVIPETMSVVAILIVEAVATAFAQVMWVRMEKEGPEGRLPLSWVGIFVLGVLVSALFVEMDCHGTLHFVGARPTCDKLGGGISIVFTIGAITMAVIALPLALRAWLLQLLSANGGSNDAA